MKRYILCFTAILFCYFAIAQNETSILLSSTGHTGKIRDLGFIYGTNELVSVSEDKSLRWWNIEEMSLKEKKYLPDIIEVSGSNYAIAINENLNLVAVGSAYNPLKDYAPVTIINNSNKSITKTLNVHQNNIVAIDFHPTDPLLMSGDESGKLVLWDVSDILSPTEINTINLSDKINEISFHPSQNMIAVATDTKLIEIIEYDLTSKKLKSNKTISGHFLGVNRVSFSSNGRYLISGGQDGYVIIFSPEGKVLKKISGLGHEITSLAISDDSEMVIAMTKVSGMGRSYTLPEGIPIAEFNGHSNTVYDAVFLKVENNNYLVASAGGLENEILIWNPINGTLSGKIGNGSAAVHNLELVDNKLLINQTSNRQQYQYSFDLTDLVITPNPDNVISKNNNGSIKQLTPYLLKKGSINIKNDKDIDGRILSYYSTADESILVGSDFTLSHYDKNGGYVGSLIGHTGGVRSITSNEKYWITGGEDEVIHFWLKEKYEDGPFASLYIKDDNEWVLWSADGYFASAGQGADHFGWLKPSSNDFQTFFNGSQFFSILFRPEEVQLSLEQGISVENILKAQGDRIFSINNIQRPAVALLEHPFSIDENNRSFYLISNGEVYQSDAAKITLPVKAIDGGSGIKEVAVYQNQKLIKSHQVSSDERTLNLEYEASLLPGINKFSVIAINFQGIESRPDQLSVNYTGSAIATGDLHVFNIGVNKYKNTSYNLNYAEPDAKAFLEKVQDQSGNIFEKVYAYSMYNEEVTKANVIAKFQEVIAKAKPQDLFIFYYAGHGTVDLESEFNDYYLVPYDVTQLYGNNDMLKKQAISAQELKKMLSEVSAQKQLILLDACHSGGAVELFAMRASPQEKAIVQLARSSGTVLLSASGTQQFATEFDELGHGVFTYALLQGLNGDADGGNKDGKITVNELKAYLEDHIPELSKKYGGSAQFPTGFSTGQDFPISVRQN
ncbi:caspase family protein [Ekhidna sp.]|uniref:caspase family protein n=1 Tax=Ekhidna sp. TaxID=2608089 RepID=UPI0032F03FC7